MILAVLALIASDRRLPLLSLAARRKPPNRSKGMIEIEFEIPLPGFKPVVLRMRFFPWFM
jgi:hypothetical protein